MQKYLPIGKLLLLILATTCWLAGSAQADSTIVKLKSYKDFYDLGLIDSVEYATLKAKLLGTPISLPQQTAVENPVTGKLVEDTTVYYNTRETDQILPAGIYMGMDEIRSKKPSLQCIVKIVKRDTYDYENGVGGNIELQPKDNCIGKNKLKLDVWIYSTGTKAYINLDHFKMQPFYNPVLTMGRFMAFYKNESKEGTEIANTWGGGAEADIVQALGNTFKKLYAIDTKTAMLNPVTHEYMLEALKTFPSIKKAYEAETTHTSQLWARYLQLMNDVK